MSWDNTDQQVDDEGRRTVLKTVGVMGAVAAGGASASLAVAQSGTSIELGGEVPGWMGRAPSSIEGQTNPTLSLQAGTTYEITWENLDGTPHNVVIVDSGGSELERTEIVSEQGATQTLEFTATAEMAEYYCEVHPTSMRGSVGVSESSDGGGDGTNATDDSSNATDDSSNTSDDSSDEDSEDSSDEDSDDTSEERSENASANDSAAAADDASMNETDDSSSNASSSESESGSEGEGTSGEFSDEDLDAFLQLMRRLLRAIFAS